MMIIRVTEYGELNRDLDTIRKCPDCGHNTRVHNDRFTRHLNPELVDGSRCIGSGRSYR